MNLRGNDYNVRSTFQSLKTEQTTPRNCPKSNANFVTAGPKDVAAVVDIYRTWPREINRNFLQADRHAWEATVSAYKMSTARVAHKNKAKTERGDREREGDSERD